MESPLVQKHRKNLPSLNNQESASQNKGSSGKANGSTRGNSNDSSVPMAITVNHGFSNGSGFLPGNSRENS